MEFKAILKYCNSYTAVHLVEFLIYLKGFPFKFIGFAVNL